MKYMGILVSINILATIINYSIIHFISGENNLFLFILKTHFHYSSRKTLQYFKSSVIRIRSITAQ